MQDFYQEIQQNLGVSETKNIDEMIQQFQKVGTTSNFEFYNIQPLQGFVIKTKILESKEYPKDTKVFINLCYSPEIPQPPLVSKQEIIKAIQNDDSSTYKVPLSLSKPRSDIDKNGNICIVFDACINSKPFNETNQDSDFKYFIIDLAIAWVQEKYQLELSTNITLPKMASKGQLVSHSIKKTRKPLVAEVAEIQKEPVTPKYLIVCEPEQDPKYIVVQIHLPLLVLYSN
jgi:hypothetical protein